MKTVSKRRKYRYANREEAERIAENYNRQCTVAIGSLNCLIRGDQSEEFRYGEYRARILGACRHDGGFLLIVHDPGHGNPPYAVAHYLDEWCDEIRGRVQPTTYHDHILDSWRAIAAWAYAERNRIAGY